MTPIQLLATACGLAQRHVGAAAANPQVSTPCLAWDVGTLVAHLIATLEANAALITRTPHEIDPFHPDPIDPKALADAYRSAKNSLLAAANQPGIGTRMIDHPAVPAPITVNEALMFPTFDAYLHSWDLAQATGIASDYPPELTKRVSDWCQGVFASGRPPHIVREPVAAPANASPIEQLAAFCGRPIRT